jgi:hypothetical protein
VEIFPGSVISGDPHDFEVGEESVFGSIELRDHIINSRFAYFYWGFMNS